MTLVYDIEANGLLDTVSTVHCVVVGHAETGEIREFGPDQIEASIDYLLTGDTVVAHNGIGYDHPAFLTVYPHRSADFDTLRKKTVDTLVLSRLIWPEIKVKDYALVSSGRLPGKLTGSHGLEAWGHRLGHHKGSYSADMEAQGLDPWAAWTPEMQAYCVNDVEVTLALWALIQKKTYSQRPADLEHACAWILSSQMRHGYPFDVPAAIDLYAKIAGERNEVHKELTETVRPWYEPKRKGGKPAVQCPKRNNKKLGYMEEAEFTPVVLKEFNPGSDLQVGNRLQVLFGWRPTEFTEGGQPKVDGDTLIALKWPLAHRIAHYQMLNKRIGQISEGDNGWLKKVTPAGRIHGYINQNGAITGRATHSRPNLGQVPANDKPFGKECRQLFHVPEVWDDREWEQLGTDMDGLELCCLGHYMARFDNGLYIKAILEGDKEKGTDIHSMNSRALGFDPKKIYTVGANQLSGRDIAKTFIYAFLYGAGPGKIGSIVGKSAAYGGKLLAAFLEATPALAALREAVTEAVKRGYLTLPDGRKVTIRHAHAALNTLLQGAGAIICKLWMVEYHRLCLEQGHVLGRDYFQLAWVHDELQLMIPKGTSNVFGPLSKLAAQNVREQVGFRCDLTASYATGRSWAECH